MKKRIIILVILIVVALSVYFFINYLKDNDDFSLGSETYSEPTEIIPAPEKGGLIQGYWSSFSNQALDDLNDAQKMREIGIDTIAFSPPLIHDEEGNVTERREAENYIKNAINKAHKEGFRVFLETSPMNAAEVPPEVSNPDLFTDQMTDIAIKYAAIGEEYSVEFFAPIVEPVHHIPVEKTDEWLGKLLPKLKEVYSGNVVWKKQSMHLTHPKKWDEDHTIYMEFIPSNKRIEMSLKDTWEGKMLIEFGDENIKLQRLVNKKSAFNETSNTTLKRNEKNIMKIDIIGTNVTIQLNSKEIFNVEDVEGPNGGFALASEDFQLTRFDIADQSGELIFNEKFEHLNNWNSWNNWYLEDGTIRVASNSMVSLIHDLDFSGYDYISINTFRRGQAETSEEYLEDLEFVIDKTIDQAKSDGVAYVMLTEFGGSILSEIGWIDSQEETKIPITAEELAYVTQEILVMAEEKELAGYMYNSWNAEGQGINQLIEIENVIRNWYTTH